MRLERVQDYLNRKEWPYQYHEEEGCGSIDFEHRGLIYHIWEFHDEDWGIETNLRNVGRHEDIAGDYEQEVIRIIEEWG